MIILLSWTDYQGLFLNFREIWKEYWIFIRGKCVMAVSSGAIFHKCRVVTTLSTLFQNLIHEHLFIPMPSGDKQNSTFSLFCQLPFWAIKSHFPSIKPKKVKFLISCADTFPGSFLEFFLRFWSCSGTTAIDKKQIVEGSQHKKNLCAGANESSP